MNLPNANLDNVTIEPDHDGYSLLRAPRACVSFSPDDLLVLRDWINSRFRQLVFERQLPEHLGD